MKKRLTKFAQVVGIMLALVFTFSCSSDKDDDNSGGGGLTGTNGTFVDSRDSISYKWVKIGKQFWMAENLNYAEGGNCYGEGERVYDDSPGSSNHFITLSPAEIQANCATYGRLYRWATADTACPKGWRLPNDADWNVLMKSISSNCSSDAEDSNCTGVGTKLKAISGWNDKGTDDYGFSALPGGYRDIDGFYYRKGGKSGYWWSSRRTNYTAYYWSISGEDAGHGSNDDAYKYSVRCIKK